MFKGLKKMCLAGVAFVTVAASSAFAEVTLPTTGVDVGEYITAGITALGAVVAVAIGGYVAFLLIKKACKWVSKAMA